MTVNFLPPNTKLVDPVKFDVSIYPVKALLTTNGVQYLTAVTNETTSYVDLFSYSTHDWFSYVKGKLAWVYVNLSFEILGGSNTPIVSYKAEAKNSNISTWTIMSAVETYQTTTGYVGERLEAYLLLTTDAIDDAPFDIRVQFKSDGTGSTNRVSMKLKNDTVLRMPGSREVR